MVCWRAWHVASCSQRPVENARITLAIPTVSRGLREKLQKVVGEEEVKKLLPSFFIRLSTKEQ